MTLLERLGGRQAITAGVVDTFRTLSRHPHPSGQEEAAGRDYMAYLRDMGLNPVRDGAGNVLAEVPPSPGREGEPVLVLQGHMDMVCAVAPGSGFDPSAHPVTIVERKGYLCTDRRSSLGADNNLGNATALWVLKQGVSHGPLRLLFTVREEVGLEGAKEVSPDWLAGASALLNTDGFHLGRAIVGSAGGRREEWQKHLEWAPAPAGQGWRISLTGGTGGHSGDDIHLGRANPIVLLAQWLAERPQLAVASFTGGTAFNAIPSWAESVVVWNGTPETGALQDVLGAFAATDPHLTLALTPADRPELVWTPTCRAELFSFVSGLRHGVFVMDPVFPQVVGASANVGVAGADGDTYTVKVFLRAARQAHMEELSALHQASADQTGFTGQWTGYPGWPGESSNPLAQQLDRVYQAQTGRGLEITAVHVGLEPSVLREKAPGLVMASTGPDILDAHSVDERAPLDTLADYALLLAGLLEAGIS